MSIIRAALKMILRYILLLFLYFFVLGYNLSVYIVIIILLVLVRRCFKCVGVRYGFMNFKAMSVSIGFDNSFAVARRMV